MKNKTLIGVLLGIVVLLLIIAAIGKQKNWFGKGDLQQVAIEKSEKRAIVETVTASGKINPETEVKLSSEVSGEIIGLYVKEGDSVKKGDLLVEINPSIYEAQASQASANVSQVKANLLSAEATLKNQQTQFEQAQRNFERQKQLYNEKIISDQEFDQAKMSLRTAQAAFETSREQYNASQFTVKSSEAQRKLAGDNLGKTRIYAPISGIVSLLNVKLGERVVGTAQMAGTELIRIADLNNMRAEVDVNENDVLRVKIGDTAVVEVDAYRAKKFRGVVTQIAYSSATSTGIVSTSQAINFSVKVKLLKESYAELIHPEYGQAYPFRPGMSATVDIKTQSKGDVLSVPIQAVTTREESELKNKETTSYKKDDNFDAKEHKDMKEVVFVVNNGVATAVVVTTGIQDASHIEITSGLTSGKDVIKAPFKLISKTLKNGDLVQVVEEKELFKEKKDK